MPQRRRRIYLVADFGGGRAGKILFERAGLQRDFTPGGETGKEVAGGAGTGFDMAGGVCPLYDPEPPIDASYYKGTGTRNGIEREIIAVAAQQGGAEGFTGKNSAKAGSIGYREEQEPTLRAGVQANVLCAHPKTAGTLCASGAGLNRPAGQGNETDLCICIAGNVIERKPQNGGNGIGAQENISYTLNTIDRHAVCAADVRNMRESKEISGTLQAKENGGYLLNYINPVRVGYVVRRLTPLECCRLQGFPDDWCEGVEGSDSAQYKMWGNGIALPCALYVMQGIAEYGGTR